MKLSIAAKIVVIVAVLNGIVFAGLAYGRLQSLRTELLEAFEEMALTVTHTFGSGIHHPEDLRISALEGMMGSYALKYPDIIAINIYAQEGKELVLLTSNRQYEPPVETILTAQTSASENRTIVLKDQDRSVRIYVPIKVSGITRGAYMFEFTLEEVARKIRSDFTTILPLYSLIFSASTVILYTFLYVTIVIPVKRIRIGIEHMAVGDEGYRLKGWPQDELGDVIRAFNQLADQVSGSRQSLRVANATLEQKVTERTTEMKQKVTELEDVKKAMLNLLDDARHLEVELKNERDRATAIISNMNEGLIVVERNLKVSYVNHQLKKMLDLDKDPVGMFISDIVRLYKDDKFVNNEDRPVQIVQNTGKPFYASHKERYAIKTMKDRMFPLSISAAPLLASDGALNGAVIIFRDVSEIVTYEKALENEKAGIELKVEERTHELLEKNKALVEAKEEVSEGWLQLQKEKARLSASINSLSYGFILTDIDEKILVMNTLAVSMLKLPENTTDFSQIESSMGDTFNLRAFFELVKSTLRPQNVPMITFHGKYIHIYASPITLPGKSECIGVLILLEDITERINMERSRNDFFSIASHELRTPLTAIRGNTSLIKQYYWDKMPDQDVKDMVNDIHESSVRLIELVNDFLDTSRLEQGRISFASEKIDLNGVIREAINDIRSLAEIKKIILTHQEGEVPYVIGDPDKLKQVLINLISNSIKFTDTGGVTVSVGRAPDNGGRQLAEVTVTDTGKGIPESNQSLLFRKFTQASIHPYTRDTTRGTGLGLYISKLLIEGMGGTIGLVRSESGIGSVFSFTIPVSA